MPWFTAAATLVVRDGLSDGLHLPLVAVGPWEGVRVCVRERERERERVRVCQRKRGRVNHTHIKCSRAPKVEYTHTYICNVVHRVQQKVQE